MRLWTLSSLLGIGVLVVACSGSEPQSGGEEPATAISQLPLSAACSSCAQTAMGGTCSAELKVCANNPSCFDVGSCLAKCDPKDVACFGGCAEASAAFNDLTECVFCDSCPKECTGEWQCAAQPKPQPSACDKSGDCGSCSACAAKTDCSAEFADCQANKECAELAQCAASCGDAPDCLKMCAVQLPNGGAEFEKLASCVACNACPNDCSAQAQALGCAVPPDAGKCDGSGACSSCVQCASQSACAAEADKCMQTPDCAQIAECVASCGAQDCIDKCVLSFPNGSPELDALAQCAVCDQCPVDCAAQTKLCAP